MINATHLVTGTRITFQRIISGKATPAKQGIVTHMPDDSDMLAVKVKGVNYPLTVLVSEVVSIDVEITPAAAVKALDAALEQARERVNAATNFYDEHGTDNALNAWHAAAEHATRLAGRRRELVEAAAQA